MGKYAILQGKRLARLLLAALPVTALVLGLLCLGGRALTGRYNAREGSQSFPIGLVGMPDSGLLRVGLQAIQSLDELGLAVELTELTPQQAPQALAQGQVRAYVVIPENFAQEALRGNLLTIEYVTTPDPSGMAALFQQEFTALVEQLLLQSEKASFGIYDALAPQVGHTAANQATYDLSIQLAQYLFTRNRSTVTVELGVGEAPGFGQYLACGLAVTGLLLVGLCLTPLGVQQHLPVSRLLLARGRSPLALALVDYAILALGMLILALPGAAVLIGVLPGLPVTRLAGALPAIAVLAGLLYLCCSAVSRLHTGVPVCFFTAMSTALVGGCMYPVWFFPESIQRIAAFLPTAVARRQLTQCITGQYAPAALWGCAVYTLVFAALGAALRCRRICAGQEGNV